MSIPGRPSLQERSIRARRLNMIKLTETREIAPYLWVHPDGRGSARSIPWPVFWPQCALGELLANEGISGHRQKN